MPSINLISAIGTPLTHDERLHVEGLERLMNLQWNAGINGVLVAGTMGLMQLLREQTYVEAIEHSIRLCSGRGELLIGVGDAGFARTADRIGYINRLSVDGVVVLPPYLVRFRQEELLDYFQALADISKAPLFLYDLPSLTGVKLEVSTVFELSKHPNIAGIKCSGDLNDALDLIASVDSDFRVIVAQADQVDVLCEQGVTNHLDGVFSLVPEWTREIANAAVSRDWVSAAAAQQRLSGILGLLREFGVFPAYQALMQIRGIPGLFAPKPFHLLNETQRDSLIKQPLVDSLAKIDGSAVQQDARSVGTTRELAEADEQSSSVRSGLRAS